MAGWYEPGDPTPREQCPVCDFYALPERGNYLICPVCFWEDDGMDVDEMDTSSGPNHGITLGQARINFREFGACERTAVQHVLPETKRKQFKYSRRDC